MLGLLMGGTFDRSAPGVAGSRRSVKKICRGCERQRALFRRHGIVRWDRFHTLCFRCFRAEVNRRRVTCR
jgi:hypothetical protein